MLVEIFRRDGRDLLNAYVARRAELIAYRVKYTDHVSDVTSGGLVIGLGIRAFRLLELSHIRD